MEVEKKSPRQTRKKIQVTTMMGLAISVLVHLSIFLVIGGVVIFEGKIPAAPFLGNVAPAEPMGPSLEEEMPLLEEQLEMPSTEVPAEELMDATIAPMEATTSSPDVIVSSATMPSFTMPTNVTGPTLDKTGIGKRISGMMKGSAGGKGGPGGGVGTLFGFTEAFSGTMEGTMVDFKQDEDGKPTGMDSAKFRDLLVDFADKNTWSLNQLDDYFVVEKKLYATHFYMPMMSAGKAPEAFDVADKVEPKMWMVIYRGWFMPPASGKFRFWGYADDMIFAKVDGEMVFDGSRSQLYGKSESLVKDPEVNKQLKMGNGYAAAGEWMDLRAGQQYQIETIISEVPGGSFCAFLLVEQKGLKYETGKNGQPIYSLFQTVDTEINPQEMIKGGSPEFTLKGGVFGK